MPGLSRAGRTFIMLLLSAAAVVAAPVAAYAVLPSAPQATTYFNDTVRAVAYAGDVVYVGGDFTKASSGGKRHDRSHLAAIDADTGELLPFAPRLDGNVYALAVSGSSVYAGGYFTTVDGHHRRHIAEFSGGEVTAFRHSLSGLPRVLAVDGGRLYAAGSFGTADGRDRGNVAVWDLATGLLTPIAPRTDEPVRAMAIGSRRLYLGGTFHTVDGAEALKLAAVDKTTGVLDTGFTPRLHSVVHDIELAHDRVYAAVGGRGGSVVAMDYAGRAEWTATTDGDVQALSAIGDTVYAGGHFEQVCSTPRTGDMGACLDGEKAWRYKFLAVDSGGALTGWDPWADSVLGVLALTDDGRRLAAGGTFLTFGNGAVRQRAFAQFAP